MLAGIRKANKEPPNKTNETKQRTEKRQATKNKPQIKNINSAQKNTVKKEN